MFDIKRCGSWKELAAYTSVYICILQQCLTSGHDYKIIIKMIYSYKKAYSHISAEGVTAVKNWTDSEKSQVLVYKYIMMSLFQKSYSHIQGLLYIVPLPSTTALTVVSTVCYCLLNLRVDISECKALCSFYDWNTWQKRYLSEAT